MPNLQDIKLKLPKTREEARALLKRAGLLKTHRVIEGAEREEVFTMLELVESTESNNQHIWTQTWQVGEVTYNHHVGAGIDELEAVTDDDI